MNWSVSLSTWAVQTTLQTFLVFLHPIHRTVGHSLRPDAQLIGGHRWDVEDATCYERAPVVDAHRRGLSAHVGAHVRAKGQRLVGGGEGVRVEAFAAGGEGAVKADAVPAADARFAG